MAEQPEELNVAGVANEPITLPIRNGPPTGYSWQLDLPEGVLRLDDTEAPTVDPDTRLGDAAGGYLQVKAPAGEHIIVASLSRPWEPDQPERVVRIRLHVV